MPRSWDLALRQPYINPYLSLAPFPHTGPLPRLPHRTILGLAVVLRGQPPYLLGLGRGMHADKTPASLISWGAVPGAYRLNRSTRDSYTRCQGYTDIARLRVRPVCQCCVA